MRRIGIASGQEGAAVPTLAQLRKAKVLSLQELADAAGVSKTTVRLIEQGKRVPHPATRRALGAALGVDPARVDWPEQDATR